MQGMPKPQCTEYCDREREIVEQHAEVEQIAEVCALCTPDELPGNLSVLEAQNAHLASLRDELLQHSANCPECKRVV